MSNAWRFLPLVLLTGCLGPLVQAVDQELPVVELFTSEGCSSCPPADALLNRLIARHQVIALAFHVDYWDYLGWRDPWSSAQASARQQAWARLLGGGVYTPCAVVNGQRAVLGSDPAAISDAATATTGHRVPLTVAATRSPTVVHLTAHSASAPAGAQLLVALVESGLASTVTAGENRGAQLTHDQVVRAFTTVSLVDGAASVQLDVPGTLMAGNGRLVAVLVTKSQQVIGAAMLALPDP